ncbi:ATP-binding protein [Zobellella sp. DQSA1]|uniref:ATP-binding protein n=1 Tax=Zobellella sp. DQSA1 TaxID=3342386 RepID=UPI0035C24BF0
MHPLCRLLLCCCCLGLLFPTRVLASACPPASLQLQGWLADETGRLTPEQVLDRPETDWQPRLDTLPAFSRAAVWLRLRLDHPSADACRYWLTLGAPQLEDQRLYLQREAGWQSLVAGSRHPLPAWPVVSRQPRFPLRPEASGPKELLVRIESRSRLFIAPEIKSEHRLLEDSQHRQLLDGVALGMILMALPFALIMSWIYRSWLLLFNALGLFACFLLTLVANGYLFYLPAWLPWSLEGGVLLSALAFILLFGYLHQLFELRRQPVCVSLLLWCYALGGGLLLLWGLFGDIVTARQWFIPYRHLAYLLIPLLMLLAMRHGVRLGPLAWAAGGLMSLQGMTVLLAGRLYDPVVYGEDRLALGFSLLLAALLVGSLVMTGRRHHRNETALRQRLAKLQLATRERLERTVDLRTHQLKASLQARNKLLARISHDLRSPLNHIISHARQLYTVSHAAKARQIVRYSHRQLELLDDLMAFARGELQRQELGLESGYLYSFLQEIEEEGSLLAERRHNRFELQLSGQLPVLVMADFRQLRRVLVNLLDNAAKFTRHGEIRMRLTASPLEGDRVLLRFSISDTGPGLPPELRRRLLDPFQRGNHQEEGYGLGLAIVAELLEQMDSRLEITLPHDGGSCFGFALALQLAQEFEVGQVFIEDRVGELDGSGYRVMLVDDMELTRNYLSELLGGYGFDTLLAENGEQALDHMERERVDLVITDQLMPGMSGWALLDALRRRQPTLPVLLYSALPPQPGSEHGHLRFDHSLLKPAGSDEFLQSVLRQCRAGEAAVSDLEPVPAHGPGGV